MHGKDLSAATRCGDFCLRAILLSLTDVDPIPDGELYCCRFTVEAAPGGCCPVSVVNTAASDPLGKAISASGNVAHLCVSSSGQIATPTPTVLPIGTADDDGCEVSPVKARGSIAPSFVAAGLLLALRSLISKRPRRGRARGPNRCRPSVSAQSV
jgi:hypothetical protein